MIKTIVWLLKGKRSRFIITMLIFIVLNILFTLIVGTIYPRTAHAALPEETTVTATINDIIAVYEELPKHEKEINMLAQVIYAEARGVKAIKSAKKIVKPKEQQAAIAWAVINRAIARGQTIEEVITARK